MAVPNQADFYKYLDQVNIRLNQVIIKMINERRKKLDSLKDSYILKNPISIYEIKEQKFDSLYEKINLLMTNRIKGARVDVNNYLDKIIVAVDKNLDKKKNNYLNFLNKLEVLNPLLTIKRGYSITKVDNKVISSVKGIKKNDKLNIELTDGTINAVVDSISK